MDSTSFFYSSGTNMEATLVTESKQDIDVCLMKWDDTAGWMAVYQSGEYDLNEVFSYEGTPGFYAWSVNTLTRADYRLFTSD